MSAVTNKGTISMYQFKRMAVPAKPQSKEGVPLTSAGVSGGLQPAGPPSQQQQQQTALFPEPRKAITAHKRYALKCAFSPDSTMVATTSADQTTRLWRTSDLGLITVSLGWSYCIRHIFVASQIPFLESFVSRQKKLIGFFQIHFDHKFITFVSTRPPSSDKICQGMSN